MSLIILKEMLEDADILRFIMNDANPDIYDPCASFIFDRLSKDLSIEQIQKIIWEAFYKEFCFCKIVESNEDFILSEQDAINIIGNRDRYKDIAFNVRHSIIGI